MFARNNRAASGATYAILLGLVSVAAIGAIENTGQEAERLFADTEQSLFNDAPEFTLQLLSGNEDAALSAQLTAIDPDGDDISFSLVSNETDHVISISPSGFVTINPSSDSNGVFEFIVAANDTRRGRSEAVISFSLLPENDPPAAIDGVASGVEDNLLEFNMMDFGEDIDGDSLSYALITDGTNFSTVISPNGDIEITPDTDFSGEDVLVFSVSDGEFTDQGEMRVSFENTNDAPVIGTGLSSGTIDVRAGLTTSVEFPDVNDPDGDVLSYQFELLSLSGGSLSSSNSNTGDFVFQSANSGFDFVTVTVSDSSGASDSKMFTMNSINNPAPVAINQSIRQSVHGTFILNLPVFSDTDLRSISVTSAPPWAQVTTNPSNGTMTVRVQSESIPNSCGAIGCLVTDNITLRASDAMGGSVQNIIPISMHPFFDSSAGP